MHFQHHPSHRRSTERMSLRTTQDRSNDRRTSNADDPRGVCKSMEILREVDSSDRVSPQPVRPMSQEVILSHHHQEAVLSTSTEELLNLERNLSQRARRNQNRNSNTTTSIAERKKQLGMLPDNRSPVPFLNSSRSSQLNSITGRG